MKLRHKISLLIVSGVMATGTAYAEIPAALTAAMENSATLLYAYDVTYKDENIDMAGRVTPGAPLGERLVLTRPAPETLDKKRTKMLQQRDAAVDGDIWCASMMPGIGEDIAVIAEDATSMTYQFTPLPDEKDDKAARKMMKNAIVTVNISRDMPQILHFKMRSLKPFKPVMVAKVEHFEVQAACEAAPDGRSYAKTLTTQVRGSAMGQKFTQEMYREITALYPLESPGDSLAP